MSNLNASCSDSCWLARVWVKRLIVVLGPLAHAASLVVLSDLVGRLIHHHYVPYVRALWILLHVFVLGGLVQSQMSREAHEGAPVVQPRVADTSIYLLIVIVDLSWGLRSCRAYTSVWARLPLFNQLSHSLVNSFTLGHNILLALLTCSLGLLLQIVGTHKLALLGPRLVERFALRWEIVVSALALVPFY